MDEIKQKLIDKILEVNDNENLIELLSIDVYDLIDSAIKTKLENKTINQLVDLI